LVSEGHVSPLRIEHGGFSIVARLPHASRCRSHGVVDLLTDRSDLRRGVGGSSRRRCITRLELQAQRTTVTGSPPGRQGASQGVRAATGVYVQTIGPQRRNCSRPGARRNAPAVQRDRGVEMGQSTNASVHHAETPKSAAAGVEAAAQRPLFRVCVPAREHPEARIDIFSAHK
jgi:hypothetical protein